ncbi:acyl--CoA ligase [Pueribacillus theae]|uniref:Acyl--CoA ligase n=1 Tax=Pueribacillus theae TaxID=2171751 RepID=A0A2U1K0V3_9BACI|nr:acyl--CoA ligase [Pueribacillus theae]PWA11140.1 acyl--CoA ligase [Pueribacillus theae]
MDMKDLLAPETYNLTEEMEAFTQDKTKKALIWRNESGEKKEITYTELFKQVNKLANGLTNLGLTKGDRVLIIMPRLIETYVTYLGCLKAGLVVIPSSEMLRAKDLSYRINHGEAKAVIAYEPFIEQVNKITEPIPTLEHRLVYGKGANNWTSIDTLTLNESDSFQGVETSRDDMAFLSYTSGTTGQPKGVVHRHGWAYAHLRTAADSWLDIQEGDTVWATAGPGWQKWIWSPFVSVLGKGATGFIYNGKFEPETYLNLLEEEKINVLCCTPTEYRLMAKVDHLSSYDLSALHSAVSAGEPLNREVIDVFKKYHGIDVRDGYGQTENSLIVSTGKGMKIKPGSMGKPTPGNRVEIIDEDGKPVEVGEVGNIAVHKSVPALFKEYYKDPERTQAAYVGEYYLTGDKARKDEEGYFWFEGRGDDIIISSGYTIGPFEVEDALVKHASVKECAVVASPDEIRGHIVKAFVVLKDGIEKSEDLILELQDHVKQLTAPYKYPRQIEFVSDLPKTTSGKIRRIELRQLEMNRQFN